MKKPKYCFTLSEQAHGMLKNVAEKNGVSMSTVLEMLIRANQQVKFVGGKK